MLVLPGYYTGSSAFLPLVRTLQERGFEAALPPLNANDWAPTLGGRSMRPILDRLEYAAVKMAAGIQVSILKPCPLPRCLWQSSTQVVAVAACLGCQKFLCRAVQSHCMRMSMSSRASAAP